MVRWWPYAVSGAAGLALMIYALVARMQEQVYEAWCVQNPWTECRVTRFDNDLLVLLAAAGVALVLGTVELVGQRHRDG